MKNPNQIRTNRKGCASRSQPKQLADAQRVHVSLRLPKALHAVIKRGAKRDGLTMSGYVERAVQLILPIVERKSRQPDIVLSEETRWKLSSLMRTTVKESIALIESGKTDLTTPRRRDLTEGGAK